LRIPVQIEVEPHVDRSFSVVAYDDGEPVGYVYVHDLPRRDGGRQLLVYDVDVAESHRRRGVATELMERVAEVARERGIAEGFVLTEPDDAAANGLYGKAGGIRSEVVMWDFAYADD
jgi:aminoglycoside 3-N-acetyltransferase I